MHYYKFNIKDWSCATSHLSITEEGIYRRLLDHYYESEKPIPLETQPVIRRLRLAGHEDSVMLILSEFFQLEPDGYHHKRCDEEIEKYHLKSVVNRENGVRGGRPQNPEITQPVPTRNPNITLTTNQEPLTTNQEPRINTMSSKLDVIRHKEVNNSIPNHKHQESTQDKNRLLHEQALEILSFLNRKVSRNFAPLPANLDLIKARLRETEFQNIKSVIARKTREWLPDAKMAKYLRPATLFNRTKFANYLGELIEEKPDENTMPVV